MRKLALIICIILILSLGSVAHAEEPAPEPQTEPGVTYAESPEYSSEPVARAAGSVTSWRNSIAETSSTTINCSSFTGASTLCDRISVQYIVYKYTGGSWKSYKSGTSTKTLSASFADAIPFVVDPKHSYYLKTYHRTYSGSVCVSTKTATSGSIYVG